MTVKILVPIFESLKDISYEEFMKAFEKVMNSHLNYHYYQYSENFNFPGKDYNRVKLYIDNKVKNNKATNFKYLNINGQYAYFTTLDLNESIQFESSLSIEAVRALIEREELDKLTKKELVEQNKKSKRL